MVYFELQMYYSSRCLHLWLHKSAWIWIGFQSNIKQIGHLPRIGMNIYKQRNHIGSHVLSHNASPCHGLYLWRPRNTLEGDTNQECMDNLRGFRIWDWKIRLMEKKSIKPLGMPQKGARNWKKANFWGILCEPGSINSLYWGWSSNL